MNLKLVLVGLIGLLTQACSPCQAVAMDADAAMSSALTVQFSVSGGNETHCSAVATGPRTFYTAHHCLTHWSGEWLQVQAQSDKIWRQVSLETPRCSVTHVKEHIHAVSDASNVEDLDGTCEMTLEKYAPDFKHWVAPCMGEWGLGESGTVVHSLNAEMTTACLEGRADGLMWSSCSDDSLRRGSSGAGLIVNGCVVGVLLVVEKGLLYENRYFFSALAPADPTPVKPVLKPQSQK